MLHKTFLTFLFLLITVSTTHAWIGLTAESKDVLNIPKWNELISKLNIKLSGSNFEAGNNIELSNSGSNIIISSSFSGSGIETPYITSTAVNYFQLNDTQVITLQGANFNPYSVASIPGFGGVINSTTIDSESQITLNVTSSTSTGYYDIVLDNNGKSNTVWAGNGENLIYIDNVIHISGDDTIGRKYADNTYADTCNDYKNPTGVYSYLGDIGGGVYWIKPDASPEFKVYCDMTTNSGGRTRYVNIKGNYTLADGIDCWKGTTIDNAHLECFNPNRYNITATNLLNIDWSGTYYYTFISGISSFTTASSNGIRKCLGHNEYMTIMRSNTTPLADGSDTQYVRLGADFCKSSREVAGRGAAFMNYDNDASFGENSGANRQASAKATELYFR